MIERRRTKDSAVVITVRSEHDHGLRVHDLRGIPGSLIWTRALSCVGELGAFCLRLRKPFAVGGGGFQAGCCVGPAYAVSRFLRSRVLDVLVTPRLESLLVLFDCTWSFRSEMPAAGLSSLWLSSSSSVVEPDDLLRIELGTQLAFALLEGNWDSV